jgi:hypothetical protein
MLIRWYTRSTYRLGLVLVVRRLGIPYRTACCHMAHLWLELVSAKAVHSTGARRVPLSLRVSSRAASTPRPRTAYASTLRHRLRHASVVQCVGIANERDLANSRHGLPPREWNCTTRRRAWCGLSSSSLIRDAFPFYRMLLKRERNVLCNLMYTPPDHGKIYTRATPAPTTRLVWDISLRYTPLAHASYARKKMLNHGGLRHVERLHDSNDRWPANSAPISHSKKLSPPVYPARNAQLPWLQLLETSTLLCLC